MSETAFELLGVAPRFTIPANELEQRHRDLSRALHPDRHVGAPAAERRVTLERAVAVNEAFRALRDPLTRALTLLAMHGAPLDDAARAPAALLLEVMELREALEDARGDSGRVADLRARVAAEIDAAHAEVAEVFDAPGPYAPAALTKARDAAVRLKYLRRLDDDADAIDDDT